MLVDLKHQLYLHPITNLEFIFQDGCFGIDGYIEIK
jgi:hypothetical protein